MLFSSVCTLCNHKDDTISQFWSCHVTQQFWTDLAVLLKDKCVHYGSLTYVSEIFILLVWMKRLKLMERLICPAGQLLHLIYKSRLQKSTPIVNIFQRNIKEEYKAEHFSSHLQNKGALSFFFFFF